MPSSAKVLESQLDCREDTHWPYELHVRGPVQCSMLLLWRLHPLMPFIWFPHESVQSIYWIRNAACQPRCPCLPSHIQEVPTLHYMSCSNPGCVRANAGPALGVRFSTPTARLQGHQRNLRLPALFRVMHLQQEMSLLMCLLWELRRPGSLSCFFFLLGLA